MENNTNIIETNEPKKKGKGTKVLVILLILVILGLGGYIAFDKVLKDKICGTKTETKEAKKEDTKVSEKTADEMYEEYLTNLKENISKTYNDLPNVSDDELSSLDDYKYGSMNQMCEYNDFMERKICANRYGDLTITFYEDADNGNVSKEFKNIDTNVLKVYIAEYGNGGLLSVVYIKENGKVYMISEGDLDNNRKPQEIKGLKNVVDVIPSSFGTRSGWGEGVFVDIEGNFYSLTDRDQVKQLNK